MAINATNIIDIAKSNGWKVSTKTIADDVRGGHWLPNRADCPTFDLPTAIVTFARGDESATMPVTPHASIPNAYRYVRGNRKLGQMLGTDGKPVLLPALAEQLARPSGADKPLTVPQLRAALKERGLSTSGKRAALVKRLAEADAS